MTEQKKGIADRRGATRRRVNLTRRNTNRKPPRAPRNKGERRIHGLTVEEIKQLKKNARAFDKYFESLTHTESMNVMEMNISGQLDQ